MKKQYGKSQQLVCTFCNTTTTLLNEQNYPVCRKHIHNQSPNWNCSCGEPLYPEKGKYGLFFVCISCGNMTLRKAKEINTFNNGKFKINGALKIN